MNTHPKRLIEVDLPIKAISAHARREKSIRHGHISTLHIWWARRPLAACRAVLCAALWPDPADEACPQMFRDVAALVLCDFAEKVRTDRALAELCSAHWTRWNRTTPAGLRPADSACWPDLRYALLDFISDFANWDASTVPAFLDAARLLTQAAHLSILDLGLPIFEWGTADDLSSKIQNLKSKIANLPRPLVADPFAGGGAIPLEALRVGADAFASDLNPVAVLLNKVVLEYIPKYASEELRVKSEEGETLTLHGLAEAVRYWGQWIKARAEAELTEFYPSDPDGATPIAYLWARTVTCEGPGCGAGVPLMRSLWLAKKRGRGVALQLRPNPHAKRVDFEIIEQRNGGWYAQIDPKYTIKNPKFDGTVRRGAATCPVCGYTTPVESVRRQLKARRGGADDARLFCVVTTRPGEQGRSYRLPTPADLDAVERAKAELERRKAEHIGPLSLVPDEELDVRGIRHTWSMIYGFDRWGNVFNSRQAIALTSLARSVRELDAELRVFDDTGFTAAVQTCLALSLSKQADLTNSLCAWKPDAECPVHLFARQALPMMWDFAEAVATSDASGSWFSMFERTAYALESLAVPGVAAGQAQQTSATTHPLPDGSVNALITDPPYYDAVPYAYLSDFFYVWLKRSLGSVHPDLFGEAAVPKDAEIVVDRPHELSHSTKDIAFYERELTKAFAEGRRVLHPGGVGVIVFASKTTASWEAILQAVVDAGWTITGSWPIDTEMAARVAAQGQARLASSIHLVVRPRALTPSPSPSGRGEVGDWRDVLQELPARIHAWMPRLAEEGVVGADAIFACLGPALEIFSRYDRVERASGEQLTLSDYLEYVWAAVANEALALVFAGGDVTGFEADARLTAMWLWTLSTEVDSPKSQIERRQPAAKPAMLESEDEEEEEDAPTASPALHLASFVLEYDAARKIAQGLGAHLERLEHLVEIKGSVARLLPVSERARWLFGDESALPAPRHSMPLRPAKPSAQLNFGDMLDIAADERDAEVWSEKEATPFVGETVLDRLHQAMLLFDAGRSDALKRFLVEDGVGQDARFWRLAQALSALYPSGTEEKRWVDGVLARKKGLGF